MADNSGNVVENVSEEKADGQQQMLPPPPPVSTKNKGKKADASKKAEKSAISFKEGAEISHSKPMSESEIAPSKVEEGQTNTTESNKEHQHVTSSLVKGKQEEGKQDDEASRNKNSETSMLPPKLPSVADKKIGKTEQNTKDTDKKDYPDVPYTEPSWAGVPQEPYHLELLKGGCIISTKRLTSKSYYLFGRLPNCDMVMEHPSISRYHAIIQYKANDSATGKKGFYLYDLGSTHGTIVNKTAIHPKRYYRLQVGYVIKFGFSSRLYILQGPEDIEDNDLPEVDVSKTSSEVGKVMTEAEYEEWKKEKETKPQEESESCGWGFGEDAQEEDAINPFASEVQEEMEAHEFKDPKKTLRGFFEREGLELEYQVEETGPGHARVYHCRVKLPVEDSNGEPLYAEAAVTGKKRESVLACAAEACRLLDMNGLLRQSSHESKKQKLKNWADNDYYDSDEDTFLDRTGSIEKKRQKRMQIAKKDKEEVETYESLSSKLQSVEDEIKSLEKKLEEAMKASKAAEESEDSLESYMKNIDHSMDRTSRMKMRRKIFELKKEKQKLSKLVEISRPASLPSLKNLSSQDPGKDVIKTEAESSSTAVNTPLTVDPNTDTRHEETKVKSSEQNVSSSQEKDSTNTVGSVEEVSDKHENTETSVKPRSMMPPPLPKHKTAPSSSISMLLEGLKESKDKEKFTKPVKRSRKQQTNSNEETVQKKTRFPSPPSPTEAVWKWDDNPSKEEEESDKTFDENYSDWVPPTDQTGDGKTKLNEKYGY